MHSICNSKLQTIRSVKEETRYDMEYVKVCPENYTSNKEANGIYL